ncbi:MAG: cytochrome C oxidase subunit II [Gammaproteobacteria bacterium]|nr:MAG: cytochrome C oxidase subunit II [Gammaproteobacteria bacterium]
MHVDATEQKWLYISIVMAAVMVGMLTFYAVASNIHPPSNVETINSDRLHVEGEFVEDLGVKEMPDGSVEVRMVAARYGFYPQKLDIPANTPVKFRIASADVLHGLHVPNTNLATMVVPGYISEVNTEFSKTGEFPMLCNEYCGLGHDHMWSKITIVPGKGGQ